MIFEKQLAHPDRKVLGARVHRGGQLIDKVRQPLVAHLGRTGNSFGQPLGAVHHVPGRTAAAVAMAVADEYLVIQRLGLVPVPSAEYLAYSQLRIVDRAVAGLFGLLRRDQMRFDLRAVDALPVEAVIGVAVGVVPRQFRGDKQLDPRFGKYLRQAGRIAEGVGQPDAFRCDAKLVDLKLATAQDLADQALTRADVGVRFDPHRALDVEPAGRDLLFHALPDFRVVGLEEIEQHGLVVHEGEIGKFIQHVQCRGKAAAGLVAHMHDAPEPRNVQMGVADGSDGRASAGVRDLVDAGGDSFGFGERCL